METKKEYIAPELTVVEFKTERGYAASQLDVLQFASQLFSLQSGNMEAWTVDDNTFDEGGGFNWE
jgi:hypothetical protein